MKDTKRHQIRKAMLFAIPAVIIISVLIFSFGPQSKLPTSSANLSNAAMYPHITVLPGQDESAIGIPLTEVSTYTKGMSLSKQMDKHNMPIWITDNSHIMLTLYDGNATNGTIIAAKATNIGSQPISMDEMHIMGEVNLNGVGFDIILNASVLGCTGNSHFADNIVTEYKNGTRLSHVENQTVICNNPAVHSAVMLQPGESVTAHVITPLHVGNETISHISASGSYHFVNGSNEYYSMDMGDKPIK